VNRPRWRLCEPPPADFVLDTDHIGIPSAGLFTRLLYNRGVRDVRSARTFLRPRIEDLCDPRELPDMDAAVDRLVQATTRGEPVGVFGDFDVDGLSGTAALTLALRELGCPVSPHIPDRDREGHGLTPEAVEQFRRRGLTLIVTVDTGSTAHTALAHARACGIDAVVTDHHLPESGRPPAIAVVNPHQSADSGTIPPEQDLSGAGVAFKVIQALYARLDRPCPRSPAVLAGLGTLADAVPLLGDNRVLARESLHELPRSTHPGLRSLVAHARPSGAAGPLDSETVAFQISPRLNAPGRLGDPAPALDILLTNDPAEAEALAARLDTINMERRHLSNEARRNAENQLMAAGAPLPELLVVRNDDMPSGLLGPLAGRLCGEYNRPAIAVALREDVARASARSVPEFDIHAALLPHAENLERFGGHARAAGFTVPADLLDGVLSSLAEHARWALAGVNVDPLIEADAEITLDRLERPFWELVESMEPFGEANPKPVFVTRGALPLQVKTVGSGGAHLRLALEQNGRRVDAIGFGLGRAELGPGAVDVAYSLKSDFWAGRKRQQLGLLDIRPSTGRP